MRIFTDEYVPDKCTVWFVVTEIVSRHADHYSHTDTWINGSVWFILECTGSVYTVHEYSKYYKPKYVEFIHASMDVYEKRVMYLFYVWTRHYIPPIRKEQWLVQTSFFNNRSPIQILNSKAEG